MLLGTGAAAFSQRCLAQGEVGFLLTWVSPVYSSLYGRATPKNSEGGEKEERRSPNPKTMGNIQAVWRVDADRTRDVWKKSTDLLGRGPSGTSASGGRYNPWVAAGPAGEEPAQKKHSWRAPAFHCCAKPGKDVIKRG